MLSFLGTQLLNRSSHVKTKVYVKPTNTVLLLLDRAFRLSSNWSYFSEERDRLQLLFFRLKYPDKLINSTILRFIATKVSDQPVSSPSAVSDSFDPVRGILPFKDQFSADIVRRQLQDFSHKLHTTVSPVFVSQKIERDLKMREAKLPLVNQQCVMFTNLNVTCAMQVMLVTHLATYTSEFRNTAKLQVHPSASTFVLNIL